MTSKMLLVVRLTVGRKSSLSVFVSSRRARMTTIAKVRPAVVKFSDGIRSIFSSFIHCRRFWFHSRTVFGIKRAYKSLFSAVKCAMLVYIWRTLRHQLTYLLIHAQCATAEHFFHATWLSSRLATLYYQIFFTVLLLQKLWCEIM